MLESDWMSDRKARGWVVWPLITPCLAAFLTFLLMYEPSSHVENNRHYRNTRHNEDRYNQGGSDYQRVTLGWRLRQKLDALFANEFDAEHSQEDCGAECKRNYQDLGAQLDMALWTQGMFWVALFSMVVTAIGVLYVAMTLKATKDATTASGQAANAADQAVAVTQEIGQKQVRAYLTIRKIKVLQYEANIPIKTSIHIQNTGQTPAIDVSIKYDFPYEIANRDNKARFNGGSTWHMKYAIGPGVTSKMFGSQKGNLAKDWIDIVKEEKSLHYFVVVVAYNDVFGQLHETGYRGILNAESVREGKPFFHVCEDGNYST